MEDTYRTLRSVADGSYREKGSKFLAFAFPVEGEDQVAAYLQRLKKEYHDASHVCYAWVIGVKGEMYRVNDDGEPRHTAGDPILNQVRSFKITNVLVAVVRYFGGTKLGKPGLINAYRTAAREALGKADIIERYPEVKLRIHFGYEAIDDVMRFISERNFRITGQKYGAEGHVEIIMPRSGSQEVMELLGRIKMVREVEALPC